MTATRILFPIYLLLFTFAANSHLLVCAEHTFIPLVIAILLFLNLLSGAVSIRTKSLRLRILHHGTTLLRIFLWSIIPSAIAHCVFLIAIPKEKWLSVLWSAIFCIVFEALIFWIGIICVYATSFELQIKQRVVGIICGLIPIANLIVLLNIIKKTKKEVAFELDKEKLNRARAHQRLCATKYPLLMVHGIFFRDFRYFNYWGRIPKELTNNGAEIFYGNHQSALPIASSAQELYDRIKEILAVTGAEKVNIIAHSKGGLDCRYAIEKLGAAPYIASLTTVNSPHKGCLFADYLLEKIPEYIKIKVAETYNSALIRLGDKNPDFIAAVTDLTAKRCAELFPSEEGYDGIFCQSIGSVLRKARSGKFPLNLSYHVAKHFDGENDGLVGERSFHFGERYTLLTSRDMRGISHGDMIDLNRENLDDFDVREFYVGLVAELKQKGL